MNDNNTVGEVKKYLRDNWEKGVNCPCCTRTVKLNPVTFNANMAIQLIDIYKHSKREKKVWVHAMKDIKPNNGDYAKLRFWGLLADSKDMPTEDTKSNGLWSITKKGEDFVKGRITIPKRVLIFNNRKYGELGEYINIQTALKTKFSWSELMAGHISSDQERLL